MSRAPIIPKRSSRRVSKHGITDSASTQSAHLDEQPPQQKDPTRPADDEKQNFAPVVTTSPPMILSLLCPPHMNRRSNSGPPQLPGPHAQESTSNNSPESTLAA
ncbi:hypothetical protein BDR03DRAFT_964496 [Suillus americanus]|nr:hypothetical protein BDR03DRAFT_964496 [Suillus americanus]